MKRKYMLILFLVYLVVLIKGIVFKYPITMMQQIAESWSSEVFWEGLESANFDFFQTIRLYIRHWDNKGINSFGNLIGNVIVFIPMGIMLPVLFESCKNVFSCMVRVLLFVMCIELFQLFSNFGVFDVDDILLNCFGALVGYIIYRIMHVLFGKKKNVT